MSQPLINLEKQKEKEIRNKEHSSTSESLMKIVNIDLSNLRKEKEVCDTELASTSHSHIEIVDINETDHIIHDNDVNTIPNNTFNKLINEKIKVKTPFGNKISRVPRKIQMIVDHLPYDVTKDLNTTKYNITFRKLFEMSPKIRSQVEKGLKLEKIFLDLYDVYVKFSITYQLVTNSLTENEI